jgi:hypothetical protein
MMLLFQVRRRDRIGPEPVPNAAQAVQVDPLAADPERVPGLAGRGVRQRQFGLGGEVGLGEAERFDPTPPQHLGDLVRVRVVVLGDDQDHGNVLVGR